MRIACRVAEKNGIQALVTGESIGPVASQTLDAMACTNAYCNNAQVVVLPSDKADKYKDEDSLKDLQFAVEAGSAGSFSGAPRPDRSPQTGTRRPVSYRDQSRQGTAAPADGSNGACSKFGTGP